MFATHNDLPESVRTKAIQMLSAHLADSVDLLTQAKAAHWNVRGPAFIQLHKLFDEVYEQVEQFTDLIAERIGALGGVALGTARVAAAKSSLPEYPSTISEGPAHVAAMATALASYGQSVRLSIDAAAAAGDAVTADLFTQITRECDKQLWFVEAHHQAAR